MVDSFAGFPGSMRGKYANPMIHDELHKNAAGATMFILTVGVNK